MTEFSSHPPGTFCWPELATTDQKGGAAFYGALFGWEVDEQPIGPTETYTMFKMRGLEVAAASSLRPEQSQQGVPPHWNAYVTVADADATATRARELGGTVLAPPFDVMDAGRMAVLQDPTGAVISVWQPGRHIGAKILGEPGALAWTELATRDTSAAEAFYTRLLGWTATRSGEYTEFLVGETHGAGMLKLEDEWNMPPCWMPYFQVTDCDAAASKATGLGGAVKMPSKDIEHVGRIAMLEDPQGGMFYVITMAAR
jgi:predicted enzyme related to lactoylglutathione lyase